MTAVKRALSGDGYIVLEDFVDPKVEGVEQMYAATLRRRIAVVLIAALLSLAAAFATSAVTASEADAATSGRGGAGGAALALSIAANVANQQATDQISLNFGKIEVDAGTDYVSFNRGTFVQ